MIIQKDTAVTMHYKVSDSHGKLIEEAKAPMAYLHGGHGNTLPKIEAALEGKEKGFESTLSLAAEDAFGLRDETLVQTISRKDFPPGVKVGGQMRGQTNAGQEQVFTVIKIKGDQVMLDGNHPLAGQALRFFLKVLDVRAATTEELAHGHVHGAHGHNH